MANEIKEARPAARSFAFPSAFTILFTLIAALALATWFVPAGQYERVENQELGREVAVAGSYRPVEPNPQTIIDVIKAPIAGFYDAENGETRAVDVVIFVLFLGGFMGVVARTGALDTGIGAATRALAGREIWMIPLLSALFAVAGSTFGAAEETLPFIALLAPIMLRAGYDTIVAVAVVLVGCTVGALGSTINPFATIIASNAAEVAFTEGLALRLVILAASWALSMAYIMRYAAGLRAGRSSSWRTGALSTPCSMPGRPPWRAWGRSASSM